MTTPSITTLPAAPNRASPGDTFSDLADAWAGALATFVAEANAGIAFMNNALAGSIGQTTAATVATLLSNTTQIGFFTNATDSAMADLPGAYQHMALLELRGGATGNRAQLAIRTSNGVEVQAFLRAASANTFGSWGRIVHLRNTVGTVAQTGGVPTDALMEYGTNADGEYWRYASGHQVCKKNAFATASGATATWTYPAAFASRPAVVATSEYVTAARIIGCDVPTSTTVAVASWDAAGADTVAPSVSIVAEGRWF